MPAPEQHAHEQLRDARRALGLTQKDLADSLGVTVMWVSRRETGETSLSHDDVVRLATALGLSDEDVLRLHGRIAPAPPVSTPAA